MTNRTRVLAAFLFPLAFTASGQQGYKPQADASPSDLIYAPVLLIEHGYQADNETTIHETLDRLHPIHTQTREQFSQKDEAKFLYPEVIVSKAYRIYMDELEKSSDDTDAERLSIIKRLWWRQLEVEGHGSKMLDLIRLGKKSCFASPIAVRLPDNLIDSGYTAAFETLLQHFIDKGIRIINLSIRFDDQWPSFEQFVKQNSNVAFILSSGVENIQVEKIGWYPQKLAPLDNVFLVGLVRHTVGGGAGTELSPDTIVQNHSKELVDVYCDFEALCRSTSEASARFSRLVGIMSYIVQKTDPDVEISGPELVKKVLGMMQTLPYAKHYSDRDGAPFSIKILDETFEKKLATQAGTF